MGVYKVNIDSFKARQRSKRFYGAWARAEESKKRCKNHPYSVWDPKYPRCYMGKVKNEPCEPEELANDL